MTYASSTLQKNQKAQQIAQAALVLFQEHSFSQITMAQIAQKAQVAKGTLFNYYPTKESLFMDLLINGYQEYFQAAQVVFQRNPPQTLIQLRELLLFLTKELIEQHAVVVRLNALRGPLLEKASILEQTTRGRQDLYQTAQQLNQLVANYLPQLTAIEVNQLFIAQSAIISGLMNLVGLDQFAKKPLPTPMSNFHINLLPQAVDIFADYLDGVFHRKETIDEASKHS